MQVKYFFKTVHKKMVLWTKTLKPKSKLFNQKFVIMMEVK